MPELPEDWDEMTEPEKRSAYVALAAEPPALDVGTGRRIGAACESQGHITEDATEDMALAVAAEYARLPETT